MVEETRREKLSPFFLQILLNIGKEGVEMRVSGQMFLFDFGLNEEFKCGALVIQRFFTPLLFQGFEITTVRHYRLLQHQAGIRREVRWRSPEVAAADSRRIQADDLRHFHHRHRIDRPLPRGPHVAVLPESSVG